VAGPQSQKVLVVDIGGSNVKVLVSGETERRRFESGPELTPQQMVDGVLEVARDWSYDLVALGIPALVVMGKVAVDPVNLGSDWVGFDFERAFGKPTRVANDAAMQALGSYRRGRMLFLGLGTGLGSALIVEGVLEPMELGHLPYKNGHTFEDYVGIRGLERHGKRRWRKHVLDVIARLRAALEPDEIVIGGGNAAKLEKLPPRTRLGDNENAFLGGFRLWDGARMARHR